MSPVELPKAAIEQARALHKAWGQKVDVWEAMNEPATTNAVGLPRDAMIGMVRDSGAAIKEITGKTALINSPHEADYGRKFLYFGLDNQPLNDYNLTYSTFLKLAQKAGALDKVDVIGLQFYPGYRFNESLGGYQGPGYALSWLIDTIELYKAFGKPIHITEFSLPSNQGKDSFAGYWREPWTPQLQAEYAEAIFTLAYGAPGVQSITWWDITDKHASVVTGGLIDQDGKPKPILDRLRTLIEGWTTKTTVKTDDSGAATVEGFAGRYEAIATLPNGKRVRAQFEIAAGKTLDVAVSAGDAK